jgi:signal transduction histidine kinase/CheY-like chemotaxis protein
MKTAAAVRQATDTRADSTPDWGLARLIRALWDSLPQGARLPDDSWRSRHRGILVLLWLHVIGLPVVALLSGRTLQHGLLEASVVAIFAVLAGWWADHRRSAAALASLGLLTSSAFIVHLSNGNIEAHFHFFVVISVVTLYQDWVPFLLAIGMVLLHHGVMGVVDPSSVYDHTDAILHPWKWAAIHGAFVLAASAAGIISWRLAEKLLAREQNARADVEALLQAAAELNAESAPDEVLQRVVTIASQSFKVKRAGIATPDGVRVRLRYISEDGAWQTVAEDIPLKGTVQGWVIENGLPYVSNDPSSGPLPHATLPGFQSKTLLCVPITARDGEVLGALALHDRNDGRPFSDQDERLARGIAHHAAAALERAAMVARLQSLNEHLEQRVFERTEQLENANRELAEQGRLFKQAKTEAEQANLAKSEFLSRISHELRTPLNAILGFAELMEMDERSDPDHQALQLILAGGRHLLELINEVLDIARIEAGTISFSTEPVQIGQVLQEALSLIRPIAAERGVALEEPGGCLDRFVMADRQRLKQVFLNLLSNAVKYSHKGGSVSVACDERGRDRLRTVVSDRGVGIHESMLGRLFSPFDRLGAERTAVEGTGLGLALSKRLVEAMQGEIGAESVSGQGSTFWVDLPMTEEQQDPEAPLDLDGDTAPAPDKHLVLYVEDNLPNFTLVERILAHRPLVRLLPAMQGGLGLELAREHRPDLILLDVHLPDISGDEVLRRLRGDPRTRRIPVIMISADATPNQIARILDSGASAYLTKPLQVGRFLEVLDSTLEAGVTAGGV